MPIYKIDIEIINEKLSINLQQVILPTQAINIYNNILNSIIFIRMFIFLIFLFACKVSDTTVFLQCFCVTLIVGVFKRADVIIAEQEQLNGDLYLSVHRNCDLYAGSNLFNQRHQGTERLVRRRLRSQVAYIGICLLGKFLCGDYMRHEYNFHSCMLNCV